MTREKAEEIMDHRDDQSDEYQAIIAKNLLENKTCDNCKNYKPTGTLRLHCVIDSMSFPTLPDERTCDLYSIED